MAEKFSRIKALGPERVGVINNQLASGASAQSVARLIQQEWGMFPDVAEKTLMQQLLRYRSDCIESPILEQQLVVPEESEKARKLDAKMDVLGELIDLAKLHRKRIDAFLDRESQLKMPIKGVSEDIRMMADLLKDVQKLQFDLGIDVYQGPVLQGGKVTQSRLMSPDGTVIETQTIEAVQGALEILQKHKNRGIIDGEFNVVSDGADTDR